MSTSPSVCSGLISTDISGPGVRIALYLQSLLSVVLVRFSPKDAPGAYWSMTSTALGLIIAAIITSISKQISLLDAIIVVYVLLLPIVASAFGISEITSASSRKKGLHRVHSPLLIVANWTRSAFTYSFAIYVWATAPTFGSGPLECNGATKLIFFGASLPALGSGRILNLAGWGLLTLLFLVRTIKGSGTIFVAIRALFSSSAGDVLLKPKRPAENEVNLETVENYNYRTGARRRSERAYRPGQIFHEVLRGIMDQILGLVPSGPGTWYRTYGQLILACLLSGWAIAMTELELVRNNLDNSINSVWGFGQVLPMVLTISPLFSLYEAILARRSSGPSDEARTIRITIRSAAGLQRPKCELDGLPPEALEGIAEEVQTKIRAPSPFAAVTVDERDMYVTYDQQDTADPDWEEAFDVEVSDMSTVVVRVFDLKCMERGGGWPHMIGFTTFLPFLALPPPPPVGSAENDDERQEAGGSVDAERLVETVVTLPLVRDGMTIPGMTVTISLSTNVEGPLPPPKLPPRFRGHKQTHVSSKVGLISFRGRRIGSKKETTTETYWLP